MSERLYYTASAAFNAARSIDILPSTHRSSNLHGHGFIAKARAALPEGMRSFSGSEADDLESYLSEAVSPLDYSLLNNTLPVPTNENIARWLRERLTLPAESIGIQSTPDHGVDMDESGVMHVWHKFRFEAAHQLTRVPADHQCHRMHGHGFEVTLHVEQQTTSKEPNIELDELAKHWAPLQKQLNHACLNDIKGLEVPTSEMLATWIWQKLKPELPSLSWVSTYETATSGCHYNGLAHRIWKEQRFEAATRLAHAPESDPRSKLHGHSYITRLHLTAPLDDTLGWTVDYGDVKEVFKPIYNQLDHHNLEEILDAENTSLSTIVSWAKRRLSNTLPQLDRIDLFQKPGCGCTLAWGNHAPALPV